MRNLGPTRDGAFRLAIDPPLSIDDARAAINKLRLNPAMLYVNVAERAPTAKVALDAGELLPVRTLMVKYRNPDIVAAALADRPPPIDKLQRAADVARTPVAALRSMFGGAYVLQLFKPMSASMAADVARQLASDVDVEWADPDAFVRPALVPNDTCYPVNTFPSCFNALVPTTFMFEWHLMPGATEVGGTNLPAAWDITTGSPKYDIGVAGHRVLSITTRISRDGRSAAMTSSTTLHTPTTTSRRNRPECLPGYPVVNPLAPPCVSSRDSDPFGSRRLDRCGGPDREYLERAVFLHVSRLARARGMARMSQAPSVRYPTTPRYRRRQLDQQDRSAARPRQVRRLRFGRCRRDRLGRGRPVAGVPANQYPARVLNVSFTASKPVRRRASIRDRRGRQRVTPSSWLRLATTTTTSSFNEPGNCNGVITVAATQRQGIKASYSSSGSLVSIAAPGGGNNYPAAPPVSNLIVSTINNGTTAPTPSGYYYEGRVGTSSAAAHVAGVASLVLSRNPSLTPAQVAVDPREHGAAVSRGRGCNLSRGDELQLHDVDLRRGTARCRRCHVARSPRIAAEGVSISMPTARTISSGVTPPRARLASWLMNGSSVLSAAIVYCGTQLCRDPHRRLVRGRENRFRLPQHHGASPRHG